MPTLEVGAALALERSARIDLRSPAEFADDHLPGASNVPLFDDVERALVGTLFHRASPEEAFAEGRGIARARIAALTAEVGRLSGRAIDLSHLPERFEELVAGGLGRLETSLRRERGVAPPPGALVLHCWRGGLRSAAVVLLLRMLGEEHVYALDGGYKAYRRHVMTELAAWSAPPAFVLRGDTGVGKTLVLRALERLRPGWTLDLEGCAGHRSSILGMVGLAPVSQKRFESRVAERLRAGFPGPVVLEGESRKVGDAIVPASVWRALDGGTNLRLVAPLERRVRVLLDDYLAEDASRVELARQLPFIEQRLGARKWGGELVRLLEDGREAELVEVLLEHYYDPLYAHSEQGRSYAAEIDAGDAERAAREVARWIESRGDAAC